MKLIKINLKLTLAILFFLLFINTFAQQKRDGEVVAIAKAFHQALVQKDTVTINQLTSNVLTYGHSNGWVQTKAEVLGDIGNGKLIYNSYVTDTMAITSQANVAIVRFDATIQTIMNASRGTYKLKVLEVWMLQKRKWKLIARQAVKN